MRNEHATFSEPDVIDTFLCVLKLVSDNSLFTHPFVLFLSAPLPNLTSDDIDSALAPASTQGN